MKMCLEAAAVMDFLCRGYMPGCDSSLSCALHTVALGQFFFKLIQKEEDEFFWKL
jgi:hypothetical protein